MKLFEFDASEKKGEIKYITGTDEAGRGPCAGGVWASAVCFFEDVDEKLFCELNDSKKLTPKKREELFPLIIKNSIYSIKAVNVKKIEEINILNASLLAIKYCVEEVLQKLNSKETLVLIDGNKLIKNFNCNQKYIIKGDLKSASIAAASILAKVSRDRYMTKIDKYYSCYGWEKNKGYLTKAHAEAIKTHGITKYHRPSFLKNIL